MFGWLFGFFLALLALIVFWSYAAAILIVIGAVGFLESGQVIFILIGMVGLAMAFFID